MSLITDLVALIVGTATILYYVERIRIERRKSGYWQKEIDGVRAYSSRWRYDGRWKRE